MKKIISVFYRYQPIRKLYLSVSAYMKKSVSVFPCSCSCWRGLPSSMILVYYGKISISVWSKGSQGPCSRASCTIIVRWLSTDWADWVDWHNSAWWHKHDFLWIDTEFCRSFLMYIFWDLETVCLLCLSLCSKTLSTKLNRERKKLVSTKVYFLSAFFFKTEHTYYFHF